MDIVSRNTSKGTDMDQREINLADKSENVLSHSANVSEDIDFHSQIHRRSPFPMMVRSTKAFGGSMAVPSVFMPKRLPVQR